MNTENQITSFTQFTQLINSRSIDRLFMLNARRQLICAYVLRYKYKK